MLTTICQVCGESFFIKPSHKKLGWGKYCSLQCKNMAQRHGTKVRCFVCGKICYRSPARQKHSKSGKFFCSKSCQTQWRNGLFIEEQHANWRTGIHAYRRILFRSGRVQRCAYCGQTDTRVLVVHHLDQNRNNNQVTNLVWLCANCHFLIHHDHACAVRLTQMVTVAQQV